MLTPAQQRQFDEQGFLRVDNVLDRADDLRPIQEEYAARLDELITRLLSEGRLSSDYSDREFRDRMTAVYEETGETFAQFFNLSLPLLDVTDDTPFLTGPAVFALIRNSRVLDLVESLIGPEIQSNPVQHVRIKPPQKILDSEMRASGMVGSTPWHQDSAVLTPDSDAKLVTVWVPIHDAPVESGCLQFVAGGHKRGPISHGFGPIDGLVIPESNVDTNRIRAVPANAGDVILIHRNCPHSSLPNVGDRLRFSLDLRYHPTGQSSGREIFPDFTARSRRNPASEFADAGKWNQMWRETRTWMATSPDAPTTAFPWLQ
ncbi:MAG: phytanoyl-CoA dioxygenase family protein [Paracoccaceae bacterium]|nr:phytanoyl-CoA dioxygenase family protein [Paracoccaceae bacterium]MDE2911325.1 phytanoyl-CoA dioxygenase family protein [Paracoccaceae bacterium]